MIKLSKKELKREAEYQEAYYFTGNVYSYENVIYYLNSLCYETETDKKGYKKEIEKTIERSKENTGANYINSLLDIIENIQKIKHDSYKIDKIAYSAGIYGNSGQLHTITLYNKNNIVGMYYTYY